MLEKSVLRHIRIRDYRPDDSDGVLALWEKTGLGGVHRGDTPGVIETSLQMGGKMLVAVPDDGTIAGTSWMTFDGRRFHLHHVGVLPGYRRQGIGRLLSEMSLAYAREKNVQIKLEVHRTNTPAIRLYRSLGFRYLGDYDVYIIRDYT